jgi:hypothetical protein
MTPVVATIVPHQHAHPVSVAYQSFGQVAADEASCAGHQNRIRHVLATPCGYASERGEVSLAVSSANPKDFAGT